MDTREQWEAAMDLWIEEERKALGPEPSFDEWSDKWQRYRAGEMTKDEADEFRRLLCAYPDVIRIFTTDL